MPGTRRARSHDDARAPRPAGSRRNSAEARATFQMRKIGLVGFPVPAGCLSS